MTPTSRIASFAFLLLSATLSNRICLAADFFSNGEPDANCAELRLWLRADKGIKDIQGHSPGDPDFDGGVATWSDLSPRHFDLKAAPTRVPALVPRQAAAGGRPTVAFGGDQILTNQEGALHSHAAATTVVVLQVQRAGPNGSVVYCAGNPSGKHEKLVWNRSEEADETFGYLQWRFPVRNGDAGLENPLDTPADGRFAIVVVESYGDGTSMEIHDGLGDHLGCQREIVGQGTVPELNQCGKGYILGGSWSQQPELAYNGQIAEVLVYNRHLSHAGRRELLAYLRHRYRLDTLDALFPPDTFLLQAEDFDGGWQFRNRYDAISSLCLGDRHVWADGKAAAEGIKSSINVTYAGSYYVWVRAVEYARESGLRTTIQGKQLAATHTQGPQRVRWRLAGKAELQAGSAEIAIRGEGPGGKDCDAIMISATAANLDAVDDICALAQRLRRVPSPGQVSALFENGMRLDGDAVSGWRSSGSLDSTSIAAAGARSPLRCLRIEPHTDVKANAAGSLFEFQNGDRLWGTYSGPAAASSQAGRVVPAQLLIRPPLEFFRDPEKTVGVAVDWLRRVVFEPSAVARRCPPRTVLCRDGRQFTFRALRWTGDGVSLLTEEGIRRLSINELAEICMDPLETWEAYYRELAAIDSNGDAGILRIETTQGMVFTTSSSRSSPCRDEDRAVPSRVFLQPVWSLAPFPVPWASVRTQWNAAADVVPLSRIAPEQVVQRGALGSSWHWQADRNVAGGDLQSGGRRFLWGFGVHAPNALVFRLPPCARAFRSTIGIDASMGDAGCVVARIYANEVEGIPLYQSKPLCGSTATESCGELSLVKGNQPAQRLVLMVDDPGGTRPAGTAPLDIGDHVNWLEPVLLLDAAKLSIEVAKHRAAR